MQDDSQSKVLVLTAQIVAAYVRNNHVAAGDLPGLIPDLHAVVDALRSGGPVGSAGDPHHGARKPAIPVARSVTPDYIVSLEDGRKFRSLTRHLMARYGMTPAEYRAKWNLPPDYPMVAPNYSKKRSSIAKVAREQQLARARGEE